MPSGMKALGGCGFGIFEISEDLVGFEDLCVLAFDDPDLFADLYVLIGDLMVLLWTELLKRYGELFAVCRMGDDLGFKSSTLMSPDVLIEHVMPQLKRVVALAHAAGKPFLWHSCGRIFDVMEAAIGTGIDAKHSNEGQFATFDVWIDKYGNRLGFFDGKDCQKNGRVLLIILPGLATATKIWRDLFDDPLDIAGKGYRSLGVLLAIVRGRDFCQGFECHAECLDRAEATGIRSLAERAVFFGLKKQRLGMADPLIQNVVVGCNAKFGLEAGLEGAT